MSGTASTARHPFGLRFAAGSPGAPAPEASPTIRDALEGGLVEVRDYALGSIELRAPGESGDDRYTFEGTAAVFEQLSLPLYDWWFGEFQERIARGAFDPVLARNPEVHLVYQHEMASTMASTHARTLELYVNERGLKTYARLNPADLDVQRVAPKIADGQVRQMSFAFVVARDEWLIENEGTDAERVTRTILEVAELYDVSIVPLGAYPQTDAAMRSVGSVLERAASSGRVPGAARAAVAESLEGGLEGSSIVAPGDDPAGEVSADADERARRARLARARARVASL